ncbi:hypothetical protein E2986_13927, partial [Frieseomelitta varia]
DTNEEKKEIIAGAILPYFLKSENKGSRGTKFNFMSPNLKSVTLTAKSHPVKENPYYSQSGHLSVQRFLYTNLVPISAHQSTNSVFLRTIRDKCKSLTIKTEAYVMKLIVEFETEHVIGVEYASKNKRTKLNTAFAKKKKK